MIDQRDTIAAIATARGAAPRGIARLAGPAAIETIGAICDTPIAINTPQRLNGVGLSVELDGKPRRVPCDLFVWPSERSYTREPAVEAHTIGSPPVLDAILRACLNAGARLAEPGEFTLRAFLAGRLDLVQAEAVLAVVDASHASRLDTALAQLAGGLSTPLNRLREDLLTLLSDLEAGLDFVEEEDVQFVEPEELCARIGAAKKIVTATIKQTSARSSATHKPRVSLVGPPNAGKSSLFNALVERYGVEPEQALALVADQPGVTRDRLTATVDFHGLICELSDTAGVDEMDAASEIDSLARSRVDESRSTSDLLIECTPAGGSTQSPAPEDNRLLAVLTKCDLLGAESAKSGPLRTSATTRAGLEGLASAITERLDAITGESDAEVVAQTAARCAETLRDARDALDRAAKIVATSGGDELISLELRSALDALGRVVGVVVTDDVLDRVFSKFCIGK